MTGIERNQLDEQGYVVLPGLVDSKLLDELRLRVEQLFAEEGENAGSEFRTEPYARRLANLVDKGEVFQRVVACDRVLEFVSHVLRPRFKLSSLNARSADPYSPEAQPLHCDAGSLPDDNGYCVCNTIWLLDDFTPENGATRIVPGSHRWAQLPQAVLVDPAAPHPEELLVTGPAGSVVVMNTHAWHGGTANRTGQPRRALHSFYCRYDQPQQQYQKRLLRPETQAGLSLELRTLLALDDTLNDELSSRSSGMSGFMNPSPGPAASNR
jgi:ectoine hydroxylase-related dioxygenase (phytanoyl-CoA dioxygenase family)